MANENELVLISKHDEAGWKESSRTVSLSSKGGQVVLIDHSSGDNPYKSEVWSSDESWVIDIDLLVRMIKENGAKLDK